MKQADRASATSVVKKRKRLTVAKVADEVEALRRSTDMKIAMARQELLIAWVTFAATLSLQLGLLSYQVVVALAN